MSNHKITILEDDPNSISILQEYWKLENNKFLNRVPGLQKKYQLSKNQLTKLVKSLSYCDVQLENCTECSELRSERVLTRSDFTRLIDGDNRCKNCLEKEEIKRQQKNDLLNEEWRKRNTNQVKTELMDNTSPEFSLSKEIDKPDNFQMDFQGTYLHFHIDPKEGTKYTLRAEMHKDSTIIISLMPLELNPQSEFNDHSY
jgi:hypothetical protein